MQLTQLLFPARRGKESAREERKFHSAELSLNRAAACTVLRHEEYRRTSNYSLQLRPVLEKALLAPGFLRYVAIGLGKKKQEEKKGTLFAGCDRVSRAERRHCL